MSENVPAIRTAQDLALLSDEQVALIKNTIAKGATDEELAMFLEVAYASDLNPFRKEIYWFKIRNTVVMPVGIDGLRRKAAESGNYMGQVGPEWCGEDGEWKDVWLSKDPPAACRVGVLRRGNPVPTWGIVTWREFAKDITTPAGTFWKRMGPHMLAKCAESHALRKAAPGEIEKIRAAGARVINGEYLIAEAEHIARQKALPQTTPSGDLKQELYGNSTTSEAPPPDAPQDSSIWDSLPEPLKALREHLRQHAAQRAQTQAEQRRTGPLCGWMESLFPDTDKQLKTAKRYSLLRFFWDTDTSKTLTDGQVSATLAWISEKVDGNFRVRVEAIREAHAILEWWDKIHGQKGLPLFDSEELPA